MAAPGMMPPLLNFCGSNTLCFSFKMDSAAIRSASGVSSFLYNFTNSSLSVSLYLFIPSSTLFSAMVIQKHLLEIMLNLLILLQLKLLLLFSLPHYLKEQLLQNDHLVAVQTSLEPHPAATTNPANTLVVILNSGCWIGELLGSNVRLPSPLPEYVGSGATIGVNRL